MRRALIRHAALALAAMLALHPIQVNAQPTVTPAAPMQLAPLYSAPQLDQLLAPIALYPDQLLSQILMAATYPLEVVEAARWAQVPQNAALRASRLELALDQMDWDPSVKALVPFPRILQMMNDKLGWMQQLGDAFLAQEGDVMDSVQRLRHEAAAAGTLASTPQQVVSYQGSAIVIESATPDMVYVPYYEPAVAYGTWPYPAYPPYFFPPPPGYVYAGAGLFFGIGVAVLTPLWGWGAWDWPHRYVRINVVQYNRINRREIERHHAAAVQSSRWEHNSYHRRGVPYRGTASRERFARPPSGATERRAFRGYQPTPVPAPAPQPAARSQVRPSTPAQGARQAAPAAPVPRAALRAAPKAAAPSTRVLPQASTARRTPSGQAPRATQPAAPSTAQQRARTSTQPSAPPAFQGISRGSEVRAQSRRGRTSERAAAPSRSRQPAARAPSASPARPSAGVGRSGEAPRTRPGNAGDSLRDEPRRR